MRGPFVGYALGAIAAALLTGCGGSSLLLSAPGPTPGASRAGVPAEPARLYVAGGGRISEYRDGDWSPIRSRSPVLSSCSIAIASTEVFAGNCNPSYGAVTVYDRSLKYLRTIETPLETVALAVDRYGYLYIATCTRSVLVVPPGSSGMEYSLRRHISRACRLAFDHAGDLFVPNNHSVAVYEPAASHGRMKYVREITAGIGFPTAVTSAASEVFVANCPSCIYSHGHHRDWVSVYSEDGSAPKRKITDGIDGPRVLAVDGKGRLYVANVPLKKGRPERGWIAVYDPGGTRPVARIAKDIDSPVSLGVDGSDDLYVANGKGNSVTVYSPGGVNFAKKITKGIDEPNALTFTK